VIHFRNKNNILSWLETHCPRKAIVRSLSQNGAELLGGFDYILPSGRPGWIVRVQSVYGRVWLVAVIPNNKQTDYEIRILQKVPWENYIGCEDSGCIYGGDKPWLYRLLKERNKR
jgi:hypothetical protein